MFDTHGIPNQIMSDNGSPFDSTEIDRHMKKGIKHHPVTPLWPHPNGEAKGFMKPLERPLKHQNRNWRKKVYEFLLAYRNTPHTVTGKSPATLLFNRQLRTTITSVIQEKELDYRELHKLKKNKGMYKSNK